MVEHGTCRMCMEPADLQSSHIIPAWAYSLARVATGGGTHPNLVQVSSGRAFLSSEHAREHLLCPSCEQVLGASEGYLRRMAFDEESQCGLLACPPVEASPPMDHGWDLRSAAAFDHAAIVHAVVGIVWKAAVAKSLGSSKPRLGPKYEESIRRYLLHKAPLPPECALIVAVLHDAPSHDSPWHRTFGIPNTRRDSEFGCFVHELVICGLYFEIYCGSRLPPDLTWACFARNAERPVVWLPTMECGLIVDQIDALESSSPSRNLIAKWGKLAKAGASRTR